MNFASWSFLGLFLPFFLIIFFVLRGSQAAVSRQTWTILASLVFYALSGWTNLLVLILSITGNYTIGRALVSERKGRKILLWLGVLANIGLLAAFKVGAVSEREHDGFISSADILIPLAISFFTFQQIGFLIACYRRQARPTLFDYLFFIAFFPHLIMGPILSYPSIERQLKAKALTLANRDDLAVGIAIFIFGLALKVLIADPLAAPIDRIYSQAALSLPLAAADAWFAALGFMMQLFLDFSGYMLMAIGLARMIGIAMPINFDEPLKAVDRFDMWRRWHITFVMFMRNNVFLPLVRHWRLPAWAALGLTAFLSGIWHGLGITFLIWSITQALLMLALHWLAQRRRKARARSGPRRAWAIASTFAVTALLGVMFRSPDLEAAATLYSSLIRFEGGQWPLIARGDLIVLAIAALVIWVLPDARRIFHRHWTAIDPRPDAERRQRSRKPPRLLSFSLNPIWGLASGLALLATLLFLGQAQRFVYVQF